VRSGQQERILPKVSPPHPLFQRAHFRSRRNRYTLPRSATVWSSPPINPSIVTASSPTELPRLLGDLLALLFGEGAGCVAQSKATSYIFGQRKTQWNDEG